MAKSYRMAKSNTSFRSFMLCLVVVCAMIPAYLLFGEVSKHGGYTDWSDWTACSKTCDEGQQSRSRECAKPKPGRFGKDCAALGRSRETRSCVVKKCPIDGGYTTWSAFTACDVTCGDNGVKKRTRTCTNPEPLYGGKGCAGPAVEAERCQQPPCPVNGVYTAWTEFSACDKTCGGGLQRRTRSCSNPAPANGGKQCEGPSEETQACNATPCPVDGGFSDWVEVGECSKPCGPGEMKLERNCTNPRPARGGKPCEGPTVMTKECQIKECSAEEKNV